MKAKYRHKRHLKQAEHEDRRNASNRFAQHAEVSASSPPQIFLSTPGTTSKILT